MTITDRLCSDATFIDKAKALTEDARGCVRGVRALHESYGGESLCSEPQFVRAVKVARRGGVGKERATVPTAAIANDGPTWRESGDTATIEAPRGRVTSLDELLRIGNVDLDVWEVERHVVNAWEVGTRVVGKDGAVSILVEPLFQFKAFLRRIPGVTAMRELHAMLLEDMANHAPAYPVRVKAQSAQPYLLEISPFDLHVGKLSWGVEVDDENYDSKIAADILDAAITDLLAKASPFRPERILFPVGSDLMHTDGPNQMTTAGTPQDADTRHTRIFRRATQLMIRAIDRLELVAPVDVIVVPGNHDYSSSFKMGEVLSAWYRLSERVTVDNGPAPRKYYRYGTCLLAFTHGSEEKHSDLPMILAQERSRDWAETTCREVHVGHLHRRKATTYNIADTHNGVIVRILPSLSGTDAWHARKGFVKGPRAMEAYLFHKSDGYAAHFSYNHRRES